MGPLRLLDEIGLDVALHVAETLAPVLPAGMRLPECLRKMNNLGLLGRKKGRGFYLYEKSGEKPNPQVLSLATNDKARALPREELSERLVFLMANEAARCLQEGIVNDPADVDFAMVMGTGFAPFRGGPLRHFDATGPARVVGAMEFLVAQGAEYFAPCKLLADTASAGKTIYAS
jgi:3-hydroxyacyl-CoA dehydrogenase/enoyl-CoA hydratase/3-hydroxybutyryl-CoA epimerase